MVLGTCKNLGVTPDYVLHNMTYQNVILYSHATPTYHSRDEETEKKKWDDALDASNPNNNTTTDGKVTSIH